MNSSRMVWQFSDYLTDKVNVLICFVLLKSCSGNDFCEQIVQHDNRIKRVQQQIKDAKQSASGLTPQG